MILKSYNFGLVKYRNATPVSVDSYCYVLLAYDFSWQYVELRYILARKWLYFIWHGPLVKLDEAMLHSAATSSGCNNKFRKQKSSIGQSQWRSFNSFMLLGFRIFLMAPSSNIQRILPLSSQISLNLLSGRPYWPTLYGCVRACDLLYMYVPIQARVLHCQN